jgi:hypothetical protein
MPETIEYKQALAIVRRLDRPTRARFVAQVVQELAAEPDDSQHSNVKSRKAKPCLTRGSNDDDP